LGIYTGGGERQNCGWNKNLVEWLLSLDIKIGCNIKRFKPLVHFGWAAEVRARLDRIQR